MKRRLRHLPLRAMLSALAGDHAFAEQHLAAADRPLLHKVVVLHHQHFADVFGIVQEDNVIPPDLVVRDVAVFLNQMLKQENRVGGTKPAPGKPQQIALKPGRKAVFRGCPAAGSRTSFRAAVAIQISVRERGTASRSGALDISWQEKIRTRIELHGIEQAAITWRSHGRLSQLIEFRQDFEHYA